MDFDEIIQICNKYNIQNYSINSDGSIDVDGDVDIQQMKLTKLPLKFNSVSGNFYCQINKLISLTGSPVSVGGNFNCSINNLTSLIESPLKIGGNYDCVNNKLLNLVGCTEAIAGEFYVGDELSSTYSSDSDIVIEGDAHLYSNNEYIDYDRSPIGKKLPDKFIENIQHLKLILKYQRYFGIWNNDLSLNHENFQELIEEIKDGLM